MNAIDPKVYAAILTDMVEKFGFVTAVACFLILLFSILLFKLLNSQIHAYKFTITTLNDQNKKYQDAFLQKRRSSSKKFLNEAEDEE